MENKGNKILQNIKIRWNSMISPIEHVLSEYRSLLMKMALNTPIIPSTKSNLSLLTNVETLLGLNVVMFNVKCNTILD
jgi:hypothetical protein